ncbi:MAG: hypothetical protein AAF696_13895 [Bacteroidota bacterium]
MSVYHFLKRTLPCLLIFILSSSSLIAQTQTVLIGDQHYRAIEKPSYPPIQARMDGPDTLSITANQAFFDDFSDGRTQPNPSLWFDAKLEKRGLPYYSKNAAVSPPSRGSLCFDGLDADGIPYDISSLSIGKADLLLSHYLDLSTYSPANNLVLSFYLQGGGLSEAPESTDSFRVSFLTPTDTFLVYSKSGANTAFERVDIALNRAAWFITEFQIAFENKGSLNGPLDVWHLDYVYLAPNRNTSSLGLNDQSPTRIKNSPFEPYTALPIKHFADLSSNNPLLLTEFSNLNVGPSSINTEASLRESLTNIPLNPPFSQSENITVNTSAHAEANFLPFAQQNLNDISVIELEVNINGSDDVPANDRFTEEFRVDSIFAYDDGEADFSFGLNRPFGFGIVVSLDQPDSISAVWISFVPTVNFNPVSNAITYMEGRSFRFRIWNAPHPDSILYEQVNDMKVTYGDAPNTYVRFPLNINVPVNGTFWVGIQQLNNLPLGVGYDKSFDNDIHCYFDSSGLWRNLELGGSLMIRPEFFNTENVPLSLEKEIDLGLSLYPNPLHSKTLRLRLGEIEKISKYKARLLDYQGRIIQDFDEIRLNSGEFSFELASNLPPGLYIWQHNYSLTNGTQGSYSEKLLIDFPK